MSGKPGSAVKVRDPPSFVTGGESAALDFSVVVGELREHLFPLPGLKFQVAVMPVVRTGR